jgi:hypothetical protein
LGESAMVDVDLGGVSYGFLRRSVLLGLLVT